MIAQGITTQFYLTHPLDLINIRNGGLGIPGAIIGGALALWLYCRNRKIFFLNLADAIIPGVALAQAIGRWGNFFNQEVYGKPTNLPWKIYIHPAHRADGYPLTMRISNRFSCMSCSGICSIWRSCSGCHAVLRNGLNLAISCSFT